MKDEDKLELLADLLRQAFETVQVGPSSRELSIIKMKIEEASMWLALDVAKRSHG